MKSLIITLLISLASVNVYALTYQYTYNFDEPQVDALANGKQKIAITDTWQDTEVPGYPVLPARVSVLQIPADEVVTSVTVRLGNRTHLPGFYDIDSAQKVYPYSYQGERITVPPAPQVYQLDDFYPKQSYIEKGVRYLHGQKLVETILYPVEYNPVQGQIYYYDSIDVVITTEAVNAPAAAMMSSPSSLTNSDRKIISSIVDNDISPAMTINSMAEASSVSDREYVIITTSALAYAFQQLEDFRASAAGGGFTTHIELINDIDTVYSGADLPEKMRNFVRDQYQNHGTRFVLLAGDADGSIESQAIPTRYTLESDIASDLYFGCLDGSWDEDGDGIYGEQNDGVDGGDIDWDAEVAIGRIPADTATEAGNIIDKIIAAETGQQPYRSLQLGQYLYELSWRIYWGGDYIDDIHSSMNDMPNDTIYDRDAIIAHGVFWEDQELISSINSNQYDLINHVGHGNNNMIFGLYHSYTSSDLSQLSNNTYFLGYSEACYSGAFDNRNKEGEYSSSDSAAEELLTLGNKGAHSLIVNSRNGSPSSYPAHRAFMDAIFENNVNRIGQALALGQSNSQQYGNRSYTYSLPITLLGDPAFSFATTCNNSQLEITLYNPQQGFVAVIDEDLPITLTLKDGCGNLVTDAQVSVSFDNGDSTITLYDDGSHYDLYANDGIYGNVWSAQNIGEDVNFSISASKAGYTNTDESLISSVVVESSSYEVDTNAQYDWINLTDPKWHRPYIAPTAWWDADLDFDFNFYGINYNKVKICGESGFLTFIPRSCTPDNTQIVRNEDPYGIIAPFWDKLTRYGNPDGNVRYQIMGEAPNRQLVVVWTNYRHHNNNVSSDDKSVTFQVILYEGTNEIKFQYQDVYTGNSDYDYGASTTIGLKHPSGLSGEQVSYYGSMLSNGKAILFTPKLPLYCQNYESTLTVHKTANRVYSETSGYWWAPTTTYYAVGSQENLGTNGSTVVKLKEQPQGYYVQGECPPPPVPPVVDSYDWHVDGNTLYVSGEASDVNDDLYRVYLYMPVTETGGISHICDEESPFSCQVELQDGDYSLEIYAEDHEGNKSEHVGPMVFTIGPDVTPPVIELVGENPMTVAIDSTYAEPGATATDDRDGNISANIQVSGTVDTTTAGTYYRYYDVTDAAGNAAATVTREVIVQSDAIAPVITLLGNNPITIYQGSEFSDPGATATDNVDGDITSSIVVTGTVDTATIGTYTIYYNVSDDAGNAAEEKTREVVVVEEPTCEEYTATSAQHEAAGRAWSETVTEGETCFGTFCFGGTDVTTWYAVGSDDNLGTNGNTSVTLHEDPEGYFALGNCPGPDTVAPVITLAGSNPMTVNVGASYSEPGATAEDNVDGDITSSIIITGTVDTNTVGTYYRYYNVSDAAGNNATQVVRTINVVEGGQCFTAVNSEHAEAGRAYVMQNILVYATGSKTYLGITSATTSLEETSPGNWDKVDSCQ